MRISFEGKDLLVIVQEMNEFLGAYQGLMSAEEKPEPTKRGSTPHRRGTGTRGKKTEAESFNTGEATRRSSSRRGPTASSEAEEKPEPTKRGRRRSSPSTETTTPTSKRRGTTSRKSSTSDIKDADLIKACSTLAQATSPTIVTNLLEEFQVNQVSELEGDARREFLTATAEMAA